jgi:hypothetical protein
MLEVNISGLSHKKFGHKEIYIVVRDKKCALSFNVHSISEDDKLVGQKYIEGGLEMYLWLEDIDFIIFCISLKIYLENTIKT